MLDVKVDKYGPVTTVGVGWTVSSPLKDGFGGGLSSYETKFQVGFWDGAANLFVPYVINNWSGVSYETAKLSMTPDEYRRMFYLPEDLEKLSRPSPTKEDM